MLTGSDFDRVADKVRHRVAVLFLCFIMIWYYVLVLVHDSGEIIK